MYTSIENFKNNILNNKFFIIKVKPLYTRGQYQYTPNGVLKNNFGGIP